MNTYRLAFRNISKNKSYTWINIMGLSLGFMTCFLVVSMVLEERSYDQSWTKSKDIYRIVSMDSTAGIEGQTPAAYLNLSTAWKDAFPEIETAAHIRQEDIYLNLKNQPSSAMRFESLQAQDNVVAMLDIPIVEGDSKSLVAGKGNLMISQSFKDKFFKDEQVIGKVLVSADPYSDQKKDYVIQAVMQDLPYNSVFRAEIIQLTPKPPIPLNKEGLGYYGEQYLTLKPGTNQKALTQKLNAWYRDFLGDAKNDKVSFRLQPLTDIYWNPLQQTSISGDKKTSLTFLAIAGLVFLISCINYINIYAVRTLKKVKSINLHKILGAKRSTLVRLFMLETTYIFCIAGLLSIGTALLCFPILEKFLGFEFAFVRGQLPILISFAFLFIIGISLLVGIYPAWVVSQVKSAEALKNKISKSNKLAGWIKKSLITAQFVISFIVIIGLITMKAQLQLIHNSSIGMNIDQVFHVRHFAVGSQGQTAKEEIAKIPGVEALCLSAWTPSQGSGYLAKNMVDPKNPSNNIQVSFIGADPELSEVLQLKLVEGRLLTANDYQGIKSATDSSEDQAYKNALITESTAKQLGITELGTLYPALKIIPVGIVADFHSESFHRTMNPTVITANTLDRYASLLIKIKPGQEQATTQAVGKILDTFYPGRYLTYSWLDELYAKEYQKDEKQAQLFSLFAALALFISALGVTGLIMQSVEQRTKEIGIRKVLGASVSGISQLFAKDFIYLIFTAIVIASPIAWYFAQNWLADFAYKTDVKYWFFVLAGGMILLVTLLAVNLQTIKAARANPIKTLRDE